MLISPLFIIIQVNRDWTTHEPSSIWIIELISILAFPFKCLEELEKIALEASSLQSLADRLDFPL